MRLFFIIFLLLTMSFASDADKRAELLGTVRVSKVQALNEAKGTYKSPKKAMFMSLIVPGSGQFYVGGKSRYIRGSFYLAEEIALITGLYYHSIYRYDKQVGDYKEHAGKYFNIEKYEGDMNEGRSQSLSQSEFQLSYGGTERDNYCKALYGHNEKSCTDFDGPRYYNMNKSQISYNSAYYRVIAGENFVLGWADAKLDEVALNRLSSGNYDDALAESERQKEYISMRKKANDLADRQFIFLGAIILNHIVSAVDAALSARAHNSTLYEENVSFLNRVRLESDLSLGEDFRTGLNLVYLF